MSVLPRALLWRRLDTAGAEQVVFDDRNGLFARGVQVAVDPVPYACRYELVTDAAWATARFEATAEGAGWLRTVRMERAAGRWRVTTAELGDLDEALRAAGHPTAPLPGIEDPDLLDAAADVDLGGSPLTNTLPLRRVGLRQGSVDVEVAWVLLPSLAVEPAVQTYTVLGSGRVRYAAESFAADLRLDSDGYVIHYPGLAERAN
jgi:hypothetical protein